MTICIAAVCDEGKAVVVASDRMLSAPFLTLEFDHPDAKIEQLARSCVVMSAGDALSATDVISECSAVGAQLQDPDVKLISEAVKKSFVKARQKVIEELVFQPRGISFSEFYTGGLISRLPHDLALMLDDAVQRTELGTSLVVTGVDRTGAHVYTIADPGRLMCYDKLGYHAIGSGHRHAILSLVAFDHRIATGLNRAVHHVYEAKRQAELAPGVGRATELRIITRAGVKVVTSDELANLEKIHKKRSEPELDNINKEVGALSFEDQQNDESKQGGKRKSAGN